MPEDRGYYEKFTVIDNRTGEKVDEPTFTVKLRSDPYAAETLIAYADAAENGGDLSRESADGLRNAAYNAGNPHAQ